MTSQAPQTVELTILGIVKGEVKNSKAVLIAFAHRNSIQNQWIPTSCIQSWNPKTMAIAIETWILDQKGVKYNV